MTQLNKKTKRVPLTLSLFLMVLFYTPSTWATPLYGGYNGESTAWSEYTAVDMGNSLYRLKVTLGVDTNANSWVRVFFSTVPFITRVEFTYDSFDILSGNFSTYLPWPIKVGSQIQNNGSGDPLLQWFSTYLIFGVSGFDTNGTVWTETGVPGLSARGFDTSANEWQWLKILNWLFGVGEDFSEESSLLDLQGSQEFEKEIASLQDQLTFNYEARMNSLLELFTSQEVIRAVTQASNESVFATRRPLDCFQANSHCPTSSLGTTIFTQEVKAELKTLLTVFAQDVQHPLKQLTERLTTP
jgi:hypothetical protein